MATDRDRPTKTQTAGCITLESWRRLHQTRQAVEVFVGGSDPTRQTVAVAVTAGITRLIQTETNRRRQRRLRKTRGLPTAASDSKGSSGVRRWIGSDSTDGGSGGDSRLRRTKTDRDRQRRLAASHSSAGDGCVRLDRQQWWSSVNWTRLDRWWQWWCWHLTTDRDRPTHTNTAGCIRLERQQWCSSVDQIRLDRRRLWR